MKSQWLVLCTLALTTAVAIWLSGCGGDTEKAPAKGPTTPPTGGRQADTVKPEEHPASKAGEHKAAGHASEHKEGAHKEAGHAEGKEHEKGHAGHASEAEMKAAVEKIAGYADATHEMDELREQIEHLIDSGKLSDVHPPAQHIALIAKRLPDLAKKSGIPQEHWKDINTQSRDLTNLFDEIDEAADAGKKPETEAAFAKMVKLIDSLKAFAPKKGEK